MIEEDSNYRSSEEICQLFEDLSDVEKTKLKLASIRFSNLYGFDNYRDVISEMFVSVLSNSPNSRKCPRNINFMAFLVKSLQSCAWNLYCKQRRVTERESQLDGELESLSEDHRTPERKSIAKEILVDLARSCEDNVNAYLVFQGLVEGNSKNEILELLDGDEKKYASARKYICRKRNKY